MGKRKKKFNCNYIDLKKGFVPLSKPLLISPAWQSLSKFAQLAYINILFAFWISKTKDPHNIICPHSQLVCKLDKRSWLKATKELEAVGFISVCRRSGYGQGQLPNIYSLSNKWKNKGEANG